MNSLLLLLDRLPSALKALDPLLKAIARLESAAQSGKVTLTGHDYEILAAFESWRGYIEDSPIDPDMTDTRKLVKADTEVILING